MASIILFLTLQFIHEIWYISKVMDINYDGEYLLFEVGDMGLDREMTILLPRFLWIWNNWKLL